MELIILTPFGKPLIVTLFIFPELSHAFNSGLKVAPLKTVNIGVVAVVPKRIPFSLACGFSVSATLNVTSFFISLGV